MQKKAAGKQEEPVQKDNPQGSEPVEEEPVAEIPEEELAEEVKAQFELAVKDFKHFTKSDSELKREDTV